VWRLNLTSAGRWAIVQMWGRHAQMLPQIIEGTSPKDLELLERLTERMLENIHKILSKAG
jgi:hypothetical protein